MKWGEIAAKLIINIRRGSDYRVLCIASDSLFRGDEVGRNKLSKTYSLVHKINKH